jgi:hypothetical protein
MAKRGAAVTYLRGDLSPDDMKKDFKVEWKPFERYVRELRDRGQAHWHALQLFADWLPVWATLWGLIGVLWAKGGAKAIGIGIAATAICSGYYAVSWLKSVELVDAVETMRHVEY